MSRAKERVGELAKRRAAAEPIRERREAAEEIIRKRIDPGYSVERDRNERNRRGS